MELAGAEPPQPPDSHVAPPRTPPQQPVEESCKETGDMRITEEKSCTPQELNLDEAKNAGLNSSSECENQTPNGDEMTEQESKSEAAKNEGDGSSGDKIPKKPDKILQCPRCNSMDTKFCYYNNYKIHQPRHFCRGCHRYWTAGGSMRNLPVGAGRRKSKSSDVAISTSYLIPARRNNMRPVAVAKDDFKQMEVSKKSMHHTNKEQLNFVGNIFVKPVSPEKVTPTFRTPCTSITVGSMEVPIRSGQYIDQS